jgi:predicted phosphate transport protein (TIGR00153 family)
MENFDNVDARAKEIYEVEQDGDMLTHDIMKKLNKTFITPIDREDLHALASSLDDVLDLIWASVDRLAVFKITEPTKEAVAMSKDLLTTAEVIHKAIKKLKEKDYSYVQEYCIEINRLENRIDRDFRDALGALFNDVKDPILIIKWKEIYEHLEDASDKCEDVANVLESIVLKYA